MSKTIMHIWCLPVAASTVLNLFITMTSSWARWRLITNLTIVYSTVYSGADQSKHQNSASLAFVWGIHREPVDSPHKWPVTRKMFFHLMTSSCLWTIIPTCMTIIFRKPHTSGCRGKFDFEQQSLISSAENWVLSSCRLHRHWWLQRLIALVSDYKVGIKTTLHRFSSWIKHLMSSLMYSYRMFAFPWWRHQMETFSASLAICAGNSPVPGEFPTQRPVTRSFDAFFDLFLNIRLRKQSRGWWFETLSCPLWRHRLQCLTLPGML